MKKSYEKPALNIVMLQHQSHLLGGTNTTEGKFSNEGPAGGWDEGGANSREDYDWDDE